MFGQFCKSILFVLSIHILSVVNMLLCLNHAITDTVWLGCLIALCIFAIPFYFFVKQTPPKKWGYLLCSIASHIFFALLVFFVLGNILDGWDSLIVYWTELFLSSAFTVVFVVDCIVNIKSK